LAYCLQVQEVIPPSALDIFLLLPLKTRRIRKETKKRRNIWSSHVRAVRENNIFLKRIVKKRLFHILPGHPRKGFHHISISFIGGSTPCSPLH
jgi:hypothetical protein